MKARVGEVWEDLEEEDVFLVVGPPSLVGSSIRVYHQHPCVSLLWGGRKHRRLELREAWDAAAADNPLRRLA